MSNLNIQVIEDPATFASMRGEWTELLRSSSSDCIFLSWEWLHTWWKHFGKHRRLFLVTVRSGTELVAVAPLTSRRTWVGPLVLPVLEFAGTGTIGSDYLDVIVRRNRESEALNGLASFLASLSMSLRLPRINKESGLATYLGKAMKHRGYDCVQVAAEVCPFIGLGGMSFEDFLGTIGPSHRYNFKRRLRNLDRDYEVCIEYPKTDAERREALRTVITLHLRRWTPRGGSDAFEGAGLIAFHDEFSALANDRGWLRLMVVKLDGQPVAAFYGFRYGHKFCFYQSGFDPEYARSSIGLVMVGLTIRDAIAEGATEYDMLHGDESYKFLWTKDVRQLIRLDIYPPGRLGRAHQQTVRMSAATRRLARRVLRRVEAGIQ
jgi:CelD/BcsL family acetyltransferase involved in cellulose biosynthesis